jgi:hypothetical protein
MKLDILSHEFKVTFDNGGVWSSDGMGRASLKSQTIHIDDTMPDDTKKTTLIHEVLHILSDMNHLGLTEEQVSSLSIGLYSVMKSNGYDIKLP